MTPQESDKPKKKAAPRPTTYGNYFTANDGTYRAFLKACRDASKDNEKDGEEGSKRSAPGPTIAQFLGALLGLQDLSEDHCPAFWFKFAEKHPDHANILRRGALEFHAPDGSAFKVHLPANTPKMRRSFLFSNPDYEGGMPKRVTGEPSKNTSATSKANVNIRNKASQKPPVAKAKRKQDKAATTPKPRKKAKKGKQEALTNDDEENEVELSDASSACVGMEADISSDKDEDDGKVDATKKFKAWKREKKLSDAGAEHSTTHLQKPESAAWYKELDPDEDIYGNDGIDRTQSFWSVTKTHQLAKSSGVDNGNETSDMILPLDEVAKRNEDQDSLHSATVDNRSVGDVSLDTGNIIVDPALLNEIHATMPSELLAKVSEVGNDNSELLDSAIVDKESLGGMGLDNGDTVVDTTPSISTDAIASLEPTANPVEAMKDDGEFCESTITDEKHWSFEDTIASDTIAGDTIAGDTIAGESKV